MAINDKIRDEKMQYDIKREVAKISALSSRKIDKYEYLIDEELLTSNQREIIKKISLHIFLQEMLLKNKQQRQKTESTNKKSIASLFSKNVLNEEPTYELNKIVEMESKFNRDDLIFKTSNKKRIKHMVFRNSKQYYLLEEKFITIIYHQMIHLNYKEDLKNNIEVFKESLKQKNQSKIKKNNNSQKCNYTS